MSTTVSSGAATRKSRGGSAAGRFSILPLLPFLIFIFYFSVLPLYAVGRDAFLDNDGNFTFDNFIQCFKGVYAQGYVLSLKLSFTSALIGAIGGSGLAAAIVKFGSNSKRVVTAAASVLANTGGVPLAFMFAAAFGAEGLVIRAIKALGIDLYAGGFTLYSFVGLVIVYTFFQIPLMVLVFTPALENMRKEWREASESLGGSWWHYLRYVAVPVLFPAFLSTSLLLFANAFSAFATARAMLAGTIALVPILIGNIVAGNVMANQTHLGHALALVMIVLSMIIMGFYLLTLRAAQRRR